MITVAIQSGSYVNVYGPNNNLLFSKYGTLYGFTSTSVSVKEGSYVTTYNASGSQISSHYVG